jgi:acyl-CoA thioester hydrolase
MPIHRVAYRVYYEDTDAMGVMYHAQYLAFAERGRSEALRAAGATVNEMVRQHGCGFVVRSVTLDCLKPVVLDDLLTVATELGELGSASVRLSQKLERGEGEIVADMDVTLVCVRQDGRPTRIPERWRDVLAGLAASR